MNKYWFNLIPIILAIIAITVIELVALAHGIDGKLLLASMTIIGGLAGYKARDIIPAIKTTLFKKPPTTIP